MLKSVWTKRMAKEKKGKLKLERNREWKVENSGGGSNEKRQ